jgi:hypothetical protein
MVSLDVSRLSFSLNHPQLEGNENKPTPNPQIMSRLRKQRGVEDAS